MEEQCNASAFIQELHALDQFEFTAQVAISILYPCLKSYIQACHAKVSMNHIKLLQGYILSIYRVYARDIQGINTGYKQDIYWVYIGHIQGV